MKGRCYGPATPTNVRRRGKTCTPYRCRGGLQPAPTTLQQLAVDWNLARPGFFATRHRDRQHAILISRRNALRVHRRRQTEAAPEGAVPTLDAVIPVTINRRLELPLAFDRQQVVLEGHLDV